MATTFNSMQHSSKTRSYLSIATLISLSFAALSIAPAMAQTNPPASAQPQTLSPPVLVNGSKITAKQLDEMVGLAVKGGATDTTQLRQALLNDLIVKEAILLALRNRIHLFFLLTFFLSHIQTTD